MKIEKKALSELLAMSEDAVRLDRCLYDLKFPDEIKAWKTVDGTDPQLRIHEGKPYYPASELMVLINLTTEVLLKKRFHDLLRGLPVVLTSDMRFKKLVTPDTELLIQVKLLRNYKGRIGVFSGVIANSGGDIVAENISKGTTIEI
jgi:3-hydroxymyristoyl/3-hydroxydecanoyl-(acyl carrier protein) dehydratase